MKNDDNKNTSKIKDLTRVTEKKQFIDNSDVNVIGNASKEKEKREFLKKMTHNQKKTNNSSLVGNSNFGNLNLNPNLNFALADRNVREHNLNKDLNLNYINTNINNTNNNRNLNKNNLFNNTNNENNFGNNNNANNNIIDRVIFSPKTKNINTNTNINEVNTKTIENSTHYSNNNSNNAYYNADLLNNHNNLHHNLQNNLNRSIIGNNNPHGNNNPQNNNTNQGRNVNIHHIQQKHHNLLKLSKSMKNLTNFENKFRAVSYSPNLAERLQDTKANLNTITNNQNNYKALNTLTNTNNTNKANSKTKSHLISPMNIQFNVGRGFKRSVPDKNKNNNLTPGNNNNKNKYFNNSYYSFTNSNNNPNKSLSNNNLNIQSLKKLCSLNSSLEKNSLILHTHNNINNNININTLHLRDNLSLETTESLMQSLDFKKLPKLRDSSLTPLSNANQNLHSIPSNRDKTNFETPHNIVNSTDESSAANANKNNIIYNTIYSKLMELQNLKSGINSESNKSVSHSVSGSNITGMNGITTGTEVGVISIKKRNSLSPINNYPHNNVFLIYDYLLNIFLSISLNHDSKYKKIYEILKLLYENEKEKENFANINCPNCPNFENIKLKLNKRENQLKNLKIENEKVLLEKENSEKALIFIKKKYKMLKLSSKVIIEEKENLKSFTTDCLSELQFFKDKEFKMMEIMYILQKKGVCLEDVMEEVAMNQDSDDFDEDIDEEEEQEQDEEEDEEEDEENANNNVNENKDECYNNINNLNNLSSNTSSKTNTDQSSLTVYFPDKIKINKSSNSINKVLGERDSIRSNNNINSNKVIIPHLDFKNVPAYNSAKRNKDNENKKNRNKNNHNAINKYNDDKEKSLIPDTEIKENKEKTKIHNSKNYLNINNNLKNKENKVLIKITKNKFNPNYKMSTQSYDNIAINENTDNNSDNDFNINNKNVTKNSSVDSKCISIGTGSNINMNTYTLMNGKTNTILNNQIAKSFTNIFVDKNNSNANIISNKIKIKNIASKNNEKDAEENPNRNPINNPPNPHHNPNSHPNLNTNSYNTSNTSNNTKSNLPLQLKPTNFKLNLVSLKNHLNNNQIKDYNTEFMDKYEEYSESWRKQINKMSSNKAFKQTINPNFKTLSTTNK